MSTLVIARLQHAIVNEAAFVMAPGMRVLDDVFVPFATVLQNKPWLKLWALLGVHNPNQRGLAWRQVADSNYAYLTTSTNYLKPHKIKRHFLNHFPKTRYVEQAFLRHNPNTRGRFLHRAGQAFPPLFVLYRQFWSRVILERP